MAQATADGPMHDLTGFQRDLLAIVADFDGVPKGTAINAEISRLYGEEINHGRLYPNLQQLEEMGLIDTSPIDDRTNSYTITRRGTRELAAHVSWLQERAARLTEQ